MTLADWNKLKSDRFSEYCAAFWELYSADYISSPYSLRIGGYSGAMFKLKAAQNVVNGMIELWAKFYCEYKAEYPRGWGNKWMPYLVFAFRSTHLSWSDIAWYAGDGTCNINIEPGRETFGQNRVRYWSQHWPLDTYISRPIYSSIINNVNLYNWNKWRCIFYTNENNELVIKLQVLLGGTWQDICDPIIDPENPSGGIVGFAAYCEFGTSTISPGHNTQMWIDDVKIYRLTPL